MIDTRPVASGLLAACAGLAVGSAAQGQMFVEVTSEALGCEGGVDCPIYALDPLMDCEHPGLCIPAPGGNFCDQPIHMINGIATGDFNNDGWPDLFVVQGGHQPDLLYINNSDGTFSEEAAQWGIAHRHIGAGIAVGDYDGDGWEDIFVASFGPHTGPVKGGRHRLYKNTGTGSFVEVAQEAGVHKTSPNCTDAFGAAFGDYDLDGDLDLVVCGWVDPEEGTRLFRNEGDGTFTDVTETVPSIGDPDLKVRGFAPRFVDMNGDRYPELLITADFGDGDPLPSRYLVNNGDGTFTDMTDDEDSGLGKDQNGMGQTVADFDGDGLLDWYVTNIWDPEGNGWPSPRTGNKLYLNDGDNTFTEVAEAAGCADGAWGWGTTAVDVDHDGDVDIVETNGFKSFGGIHTGDPMYLYLNNGDATEFVTADPADSGLDDTGFGRGLLGFDYDLDGDMDIVNANFESELSIFENMTIDDPDQVPGDANYLKVRIDTSGDPGVIAPDGFGVQVVANAGDIHRRVSIDGGNNYLGQSELVAHIGLGTETVVDELIIEWPNGVDAVRTNVPANQTLTVEFCRGDWNGDGEQNILDFVAYSDDWSTGLEAADIDDNGNHNVLDFVAWQYLYVGCLNSN